MKTPFQLTATPTMAAEGSELMRAYLEERQAQVLRSIAPISNVYDNATGQPVPTLMRNQGVLKRSVP